MKNFIYRALAAEKRLFFILAAIVMTASVMAQEITYKSIEEEKIEQIKAIFGPASGGEGSLSGGTPMGAGKGTSNGIEWSMAGRSVRGSLPKPSDRFNQEGTVIVQIRINATGDVLSATIAGGNVSDKQTLQAALDAAKKTKFTQGNGDQMGTITYQFKFN